MKMRELSVKDFILMAFGLTISVIGFFFVRTLNTIEANQSDQEKRLTAIELSQASHSSLKDLFEVKFKGFDRDFARMEAKIDILYEEKRKK